MRSREGKRLILALAKKAGHVAAGCKPTDKCVPSELCKPPEGLKRPP